MSLLAVARYGIGQRVSARWHAGGNVSYEATVQSVNADGTYDLLYSDGDRDSHTPEVQLLVDCKSNTTSISRASSTSLGRRWPLLPALRLLLLSKISQATFIASQIAQRSLKMNNH